MESHLTQLQRLLHEIDGHLGLAVHRDDHSDDWKSEASALIARIRFWLTELQLDAERRAEIAIMERKVEATLEEYQKYIKEKG